MVLLARFANPLSRFSWRLAQSPPCLASFATTSARLAADPKYNDALIAYVFERLKMAITANDQQSSVMLGAWLTEVSERATRMRASTRLELTQHQHHHHHHTAAARNPQQQAGTHEYDRAAKLSRN